MEQDRVFAASSTCGGRSPETFAFINSFLNSSRPERTQTDRQTDRQAEASIQLLQEEATIQFDTNDDFSSPRRS